ncbi:MAG TPA: hypothetical protein V6D33_14210 [Cyanophyceae cyanobacterium]
MSWKKSLIILLAIIMLLTTMNLVKADDNDVISQVTSNPQPNLVLAVERQAGNCPKQVGMWVLSFGYIVDDIGQSKTLIIADTLAFADAAELVSEQRTLTEYKAPLQKAYIDCIGTAIYPVQSESNSIEAHYRFEFKDGIVKFTTQLDEADGYGFGFGDKKIFGLRPYLTLNSID